MAKRTFDEHIDAIKKQGEYIKGSSGNMIWVKHYLPSTTEEGKHKGQIPTIFVHGFSGSSYPYEKFYDYFKKKKRPTIIYDHRGHGFSEDAPDQKYSIEYFSEDLKTLIDTLGLEKVNLAGHCFGGMVVMDFCGRYPDRVNAITVMSSRLKYSDNFKDRLVEDILKESDRLSKIGLKKLFFFREPIELDYTTIKNDGDWYIPRIIEDLKRTSLNVAIKILEDLFVEDLTEAATTIKIPTLIIHGKKDTVNPVENAYDIHSHIKDSQLEIFRQAAHCHYTVDPKSVLPKHIYKFLKKTKSFSA